MINRAGKSATRSLALFDSQPLLSLDLPASVRSPPIFWSYTGLPDKKRRLVTQDKALAGLAPIESKP